MGRKRVSRDVDLTRHMVFGRVVSDNPHVEMKAGREDYRRFNVYKDESFRATTSSTVSVGSSSFDFNYWTAGSSLTTTGLSSVTGVLDYSRTVEIEEHICWRKLFKDPRIYTEGKTIEECIEEIKQWNFPRGSREDRLSIKMKLKKMADDGNICDCCGKMISRDIKSCFKKKEFESLCDRCENSFYKDMKSICWGSSKLKERGKSICWS